MTVAAMRYVLSRIAEALGCSPDEDEDLVEAATRLVAEVERLRGDLARCREAQRATAEGWHGHSAEHAIECALGQAWLESQGLWPRKASDDDDDDEDEGCACDDCASCGGSGGGDPPMVCRSCGGSGRSRSEPSEPDYYGDEDDDGEGRGSDWSAWRAREW